MTHALTAPSTRRHFNAAFFADHTAMFEAFVLAAQAFVILDRPENTGTEQAITPGLKVR